MSVSLDEFGRLDIRVGKITEVEDMPQARKPLYSFVIDFGPIGTKRCVGGIKAHYQREQLLGKTVVAVINLQAKPIAGVVSECMMLAAYDESRLSLLVPDKDMPAGTKIS